VVFKWGHDRKSSSPILIYEEDFLITDPFAAYELDSQLIIDLPNQGKFVLLNTKSGKWVNEQSYSKLFNPVSVSNLKSLINDLRKADPQFKQLTNINSGWFTSHQSNIIYIGYANYSREPVFEYDDKIGTANILLVLDQNLTPSFGSLLFPASVQIVAPPPAIAYYPNAYINGTIINNYLYIPNYHLNVSLPLESLHAFSVWDITSLSQIKESTPIGITSNFLSTKQLAENENEAVFFANLALINIKNNDQLIAISQDGMGENLSNGEPIIVHPNSILIQGLRGKNSEERMLFFDNHDKNKSNRRYFTTTNYQMEDSIPIIPPDGYTIKRIVEQRNNHFTNAKFILSKNDSLYLWSYSY
jgi:hypothetical protein